MNLLCLGGRTLGLALAHEIIQIYLAAHFTGAERFLRRLAKVAALESVE
jgi:ribose 5-phosphate isomerase B